MKSPKIIILLLLVGILFSCGEDEELTFSTSTKSGFLKPLTIISELDAEDSIKIDVLVQPGTLASLNITFDGDELVYGENFRTSPAAQNGSFSISTDAEGQASFYFIGNYIDISRTNDIQFTITNVNNGELGQQAAIVHKLKITKIFFNETFNGCVEGLPSGWSTFSESSSANWTCSDELRGLSGGKGDYAAQIYGVGADNASADWLITPQILLLEERIYSFEFYSAKRFEGPDLQVLVSTDYTGTGDPTMATWSRLSIAEQRVDSTEESFDYRYSGPISITERGNVNLAFFYSSTGTLAGEGALYRVDNFRIFEIESQSIGDDAFALPFIDNFEDCNQDFVTPDNWNEVFITGSKTDRGWGCRNDGLEGGRAVRASAFGGATGYDNAWLITDKMIDLTNVTEANLTVDIISGFDGDGSLKILWSANYSGSGSPLNAVWSELNVADQLPEKGSGSYTEITASLNEAAGFGIYLAFQFEGGTSANSASYAIDNVEVKSGSGGSGGGSGGGGSSGTIISLPFSDDFEGCTENFATPDQWIEAFVSGSKTDRGWGCRDEGNGGGRAVRASAFGGNPGSDNAWLITDGAVDLTTITSAELTFDIKSSFDGLGTLSVKWSEDYSGSGDPSSATWNIVSGIDAQLPAKGSNSYTTVSSSLNDAVGKQVYVAFQYEGATNDDSASYELDNVSISGN